MASSTSLDFLCGFISLEILLLSFSSFWFWSLLSSYRSVTWPYYPHWFFLLQILDSVLIHVTKVHLELPCNFGALSSKFAVCEKCFVSVFTFGIPPLMRYVMEIAKSCVVQHDACFSCACPACFLLMYGLFVLFTKVHLREFDWKVWDDFSFSMSRCFFSLQR